MKKIILGLLLAPLLAVGTAGPVRGAFDLQFSINSPGLFTAHELQLVNTALGQENDPDYLAYAVEYVLTTTGAWK